MNVTKLIAAVAVFAAANTAFAAEWVEFNDFKPSLSRAEVKAELNAAQANGSYAAARQEYAAPAEGVALSKTRSQVVAELNQSQADGSYAALHQQYEGQVPGLNRSASTRLAGAVQSGNTN